MILCKLCNDLILDDYSVICIKCEEELNKSDDSKENKWKKESRDARDDRKWMKSRR